MAEQSKIPEEAQLLREQEVILAHRDEFIYMLEHAPVVHIGELEDVRPETEYTYTNEVVLKELSQDDPHLPPRVKHSNGIRIFCLQSKDGQLMAIFKPRIGEREDQARTFNIPSKSSMYIREASVYLIDYYAEMGLVPPTVVREIDGQVGSLQLYIPPEIADVPSRVSSLNREVIHSSKKWKMMALLDELVDNCDRNEFNYLINIFDQSEIFAVDHGACFCRMGDDDTKAINYFKKHPEQAVLDEEMRVCLRRLLGNEEEIVKKAPIHDLHIAHRFVRRKPTEGEYAYLSIYDRENIFYRAEKLLEANSILAEF